MTVNTTPHHPEEEISSLLRTIDQPARLRILLTINRGEACVCHLEAVLNLRQAYISQHLMALREAGILTTRREGRFIFYRLKDGRILDLIKLAGELSGIPANNISGSPTTASESNCCCPHCEAAETEIIELSAI